MIFPFTMPHQHTHTSPAQAAQAQSQLNKAACCACTPTLRLHRLPPGPTALLFPTGRHWPNSPPLCAGSCIWPPPTLICLIPYAACGACRRDKKEKFRSALGFEEEVPCGRANSWKTFIFMQLNTAHSAGLISDRLRVPRCTVSKETYTCRDVHLSYRGSCQAASG